MNLHNFLFILVCEYYAHIECQDFAIADCKENATYVPGKDLSSVKHVHHWREGNLPQSSKCASCKKTCWSSECLTGNIQLNCPMIVSQSIDLILFQDIAVNGVVLLLMEVVVISCSKIAHSESCNQFICHLMLFLFHELKCQWKQ